MIHHVATVEGPVVICADHRRLTVLPADHVEKLVAMFRRQNARIDLSAVLVSGASAVAILQMVRVIAEAKNPSRRAFRSPDDVIDWLEPHLTEEENRRVAAFLFHADVTDDAFRVAVGSRR